MTSPSNYNFKPYERQKKPSHKAEYIAAGLKLMPSGRMNNYQWVKLMGRLGSKKDSTWIRDPKNKYKGHHLCCGSKRDYYHKISCKAASGPDDLSDLKDINEKNN